MIAGDEASLAGISVDGVRVGYEGLKVLENVTIKIRKGTVVALLGPNGCGKTTLLKIINGMLKPSAGTVYVDGRSVINTSPVEISKTMAIVSQLHKSTFPFSVEDVILTGRMPYIPVFSVPGNSDYDKVDDLLSLLGISHLKNKPYTLISGGERQLVMIAKALAQEPEFLLLDEPTTFLDLKNQIHVLSTVVRLARSRNITVLMTLHDPNHAMLFADEIVLMRKFLDPDNGNCHGYKDNNIVASGDPCAVMTPASIKEAYGVDVEILEHNRRRIILPLSEM